MMANLSIIEDQSFEKRFQQFCFVKQRRQYLGDIK